MIDLKKLFEPFPQEAISWRAQRLTDDGKKAMALAYIDARDVMNRLDEVCGAAGWQRKYSHANGKTVCDIGIKIDNEWIWKADGAGDTDIEAEKGAISDAFKRAAVNWGIGRYLYDLDAPWVPCDTYKDRNGNLKFSRFTVSPWDYVNGKSIFSNAALRKQFCENVVNSYSDAETEEDLRTIAAIDAEKLTKMRKGSEHDKLAVEHIEKEFKIRLQQLRTIKTVDDEIRERQNAFR